MLFGFGDDTFDGLTLLAARRQLKQLEDLVKPIDLSFGLLAMRLQSLLELLGVGFLHHTWEGLEDMFFCVVDVLEGLNEQVFHRLDGHLAVSDWAWRRS